MARVIHKPVRRPRLGRSNVKHVAISMRAWDDLATYPRDIFMGFMQYASQKRDWRILGRSYGMPADCHYNNVMELRDRKCDALVFVRPERELLDLRKICDFPILCICDFYGVHHNFPCVMPDDVEIGRMGARHFIQKGYKHLAFFGTSATDFSELRMRGFIEVCEENGVDYSTVEAQVDTEQLIDRGILFDQSRSWKNMAYLAGLIQNLPKPVGIMIGHDARYWQVYEVCDILQLSIPDDVAVLGVDNNPLVCLSTPVGLSSVDPGYLEMGARAAELLDRCFQGEPLPTAPVLMAPRQLVERESTNTHAVEDPHVSAALRILRESFHEPLTMRKIAERVGISKDHLARLFTRQTGHSLHQELLRLRMEHSQRLLSETTLPLQEIAESIGMRQASHFAALFKNYSGETAGEWRRKNMLKSPKTPF